MTFNEWLGQLDALTVGQHLANWSTASRTVQGSKMLRLYPPSLHFAGEPVDSSRSLRVWQRPSSADPTIKPVMFRVREVNREQRVMTSTFLGWVAYQLSSHRLSVCADPRTQKHLETFRLRGEGLNNITVTKSCTSCVLNSIHVQVHGRISVSQSCYKFTNNLSIT